MTPVDRLIWHVCVKTPDGMRGAHIAFMQEVWNAAETRQSVGGNGATNALPGQINSQTAQHTGPALFPAKPRFSTDG